MSGIHRTTSEPVHDVLAAEEFGVPAPDPALHREPPRDVLAAEEFGVPAPDPALHHRPVKLPEDPTGIPEAHDVLAAEEFALPAPRDRGDTSGANLASRTSRARRTLLAGGAMALVVLRCRSRRRAKRRN